jgi:hypothetical protein
MKRILTVLALVAFSCALGFTVTGSISTKVYPTIANNWGNNYAMSLPETSLNLDFGNGFTFGYVPDVYLLKDGGDNGYLGGSGSKGFYQNSFKALQTASGDGGDATGPGYFSFGYKVSDAVSLGLGFNWMTRSSAHTSGNSNIAVGATVGETNNNSESYNLIRLDPNFSFKISDMLSLSANLKTRFYGGAAVSNDNNAGYTNNTTIGGYSIDLQPVLSISMDALSLSPGGSFQMANDTLNTVGSASVSNNVVRNHMQIEVGTGVGYKINDSFKVNARLGFQSASYSMSQVVTNVTNSEVDSVQNIPLAAGITYTGIPNLALSLSLGYSINLAATETSVSGNSTNNITGSVDNGADGTGGAGFFGTDATGGFWNWSPINPLIAIGGNFDVTDKFSVNLGVSTLLTINGGNSRNSTTKECTTDATSIGFDIAGWASYIGFTCKF